MAEICWRNLQIDLLVWTLLSNTNCPILIPKKTSEMFCNYRLYMKGFYKLLSLSVKYATREVMHLGALMISDITDFYQKCPVISASGKSFFLSMKWFHPTSALMIS